MNEKKKIFYCFFIQIIFLLVIIFFDQRSSTVPLLSVLIRSLSIAISYLTYDISGYIGLDQVYTPLFDIASHKTSSATGFLTDNYTKYKEVNFIANERILEATQLSEINRNLFHGYNNDIGYVFYTILALKIFGFKIQSLAILFAFLIIIPSIIFFLSMKDNKNAIYLLITLITIIIIAIFISLGADKNLGAVYNPRFIPILTLIPYANIIFLTIRRENNKTGHYLAIFFQTLILLFVILTRSSSSWIVLAFFIFLIFSFIAMKMKIYEIKLKNFILVLIVPFFLILSNYILKNNIENKRHEIYNEKIYKTRHVFWHSLLVGFVVDKKMWKKHVCYELDGKNSTFNQKHFGCNEIDQIFPFASRLENYLKNDYSSSDTWVFQSSIKYLIDNNLPITIAPKNAMDINELNISSAVKDISYWYVDEYEKVNYLNLLNIIKSDPLDFIIIQFFYKPTKYFYELSHSIKYFIKFIFRSKMPFLTIIFILFLLSNYYYLLKSYIKKRDKEKSCFAKETFWLIALPLFLSSILVPFIFYPLIHTIISSIATLMLLILSIINNNIFASKK